MSSVADRLSSAALSQFDSLPVSVSYISKTQDWPTRQKLQYNCMLSYMKADFHGLQDFYEQMDIYSASSFVLSGPWLAIRQIISMCKNMLQKLITDAVMGEVGKFVSSIYGFSRINLQPQEILSGVESKLGL